MGLLMTISSPGIPLVKRSEEHTSELQSQSNLVCRLLLEKKTLRSEAHTSELQSQSIPTSRLLLYTHTHSLAYSTPTTTSKPRQSVEPTAPQATHHNTRSP